MNCIVSVAFREPYVTHSKRQEGIIKSTEDISTWYYRDKLPMKNYVLAEAGKIVGEFQKSLYGFKPHAIRNAKNNGHDKIIWLDPSVLPTTPVQILFDALDTHPLIIRSGEEPLAKMSNKKSKDWFGVTDEDIKNEKTCAGTIYGFNFNHPKAVEVFELWKKAEEEGIFQDQDAFMAGNWADESAMGLALYKCNAPRYFPENFRYLNQKEI